MVGIGHHCWHLPREVEPQEGYGHTEVTHWFPLRVQFWKAVGLPRAQKGNDDGRMEAVHLGYLCKTCGHEKLEEKHKHTYNTNTFLLYKMQRI